jgi:hypothetical protein
MALDLAGRAAPALGNGGEPGRAIVIAPAREGARAALVQVRAEASDGRGALAEAASAAAHAVEWDLSDLAPTESHARSYRDNGEGARPGCCPVQSVKEHTDGILGKADPLASIAWTFQGGRFAAMSHFRPKERPRSPARSNDA